MTGLCGFFPHPSNRQREGSDARERVTAITQITTILAPIASLQRSLRPHSCFLLQFHAVACWHWRFASRRPPGRRSKGGETVLTKVSGRRRIFIMFFFSRDASLQNRVTPNSFSFLYLNMLPPFCWHIFSLEKLSRAAVRPKLLCVLPC